MTVRVALLCFGATTIAIGGCMRSGGSLMGIPLRDMKRFESEWGYYAQLRSLKALAVAGDLDGVYVSGFAFAYPVQTMANAEALENCEERRVDRNVNEACYLYAVGNDRVDESARESGSDSSRPVSLLPLRGSPLQE